MRFQRDWLPWLGIVGLALLGPAASPAQTWSEEEEAVPWWAGNLGTWIGVDYSRGRYGAKKDTHIVYIPWTISYELYSLDYTPVDDSLELRVTVPYLYTSSPDAIVGAGDDVVVIGGDRGQRRSESGLGDVAVALTWYWYPEDPRWPVSEWGVRVKAPTASESDGLGTGEPDVSLDLTLSRRFGPLILFAGGGYRFVGDSGDRGVELRDVGFASGGVSVLLGERLSLGAEYGWRQGSAQGVESGAASEKDAHELTVFASTPIGSVSLGPYASTGFNNASPDFAVGLQIGTTWWLE